MQVYISDTIEDIMEGTLHIEKEIESHPTCSFTVRDLNNEKSFVRGQPVRIEDSGVIFKGYIATSEKIPITHSNNFVHDIVVNGMHYLADKRRVAFSFNTITCGDVAKYIVDNVLVEEGVTYNTESIEDGPELVEAVSNYEKCSNVLDDLAELARNFWWKIDSDKVLHFRSYDSVTASWTLTPSRIKGEPKVKQGNNLYRNVQHVSGSKDTTDLQTETQTGDGEKKAFALGYKIAEKPTVYVDRGSGFVEENVARKGSGIGAKWFWEKSSEVLRQDDEETVLTATDILKVEYIGEYQIRPIAERADSIEKQKTIEGDTSGKVESVMSDPDLSDRNAILNEAEARLDKYAQESTTLKYTTLDSGLDVGELQPVNELTEIGITEPLLITRLDIVDRNGIIEYDIHAIKGPKHETYSKFFSDLIKTTDRALRAGLSDDEIILLLRKQEDILELSEELTITEETYWKWYSDEGRYQSDDTIINSDTVIISSDDSGGKLITHFLGSISTYELDKDIVGFSEVSY